MLFLCPKLYLHLANSSKKLRRAACWVQCLCKSPGAHEMGRPRLLEQGGMRCPCQTLPIPFTCSVPGPVARRSAQWAHDTGLAEAHFSGGDRHLQTSTVACTLPLGRLLLEGTGGGRGRDWLLFATPTEPSAASPRAAVRAGRRGCWAAAAQSGKWLNHTVRNKLLRCI